MARTLQQIRAETAFWLDDPKKTKWDDPQLDVLIGIAYPLVVAVVESSGKLWNLSRSKKYATVVSTARDYAFDETKSVRRPVVAHRVEGITDEADVADNLGRTPLAMRPFTDSAATVPYYPALDIRAVGEWVSLYRASDGAWILHFEALEPRPQVIEISYVPSIEDLTVASQYPTMVPWDFHHLIGMRAAMLAKGTENRTNQNVYAEYGRAEGEMLGELASLKAHGSQRF